MYKKLQRQIITALKITLQGILLQSVFVSLLIANDSNAQRQRSIEDIYIDINFQNASLESVLREISSKSALNFSYEGNNIPLKRKISAHASHESVANILRNISKSAKVKFKRVNGNIFVATLKNDNLEIVQEEFLAEVDITGKITDENGEGLPGASVVVKGTSSGTTSDLDGNYKLSAEEGVTLVFSFVGYTAKEFVVGSQSVIDIQMQVDAEQLEEVVVVGYGTQKKSDVTGSVATVKGGKLTVAPMPNLSAGLAGKLTGVITSQQTGVPGFDNTTIRIRGASSLNNNSALVIVDGIERPLNRINPNEIESITVLKDAASAAIYGARAANGVILVTTKRGGDKPAQFNYSASFGTQRITRHPEYMNAYQYAKLITEAQLNDNPNLDPDELRFTEQQIEDYRTGKLPSTDWFATVLDDSAPIQQHNLSVDGGNQNTKYFFSLGYLDQKGLYSTSGYKSYSVRSNIDTEIRKNLSIGLDLAGRLEKVKNTGAGGLNTNPGSLDFGTNQIMAGLANANPTLPAWVDGDGDGEVDDFGYDGRVATALGRAIGAGEFNRSNNVFQSSLSLRYDMPWVKGLYAKARYSYDATFRQDRNFELPYTYYVTTANGFSEATSRTSPRLHENRKNFDQRTAQASIGYDTSFGENVISALLLYEQVENSEDEISAFRDGFLGTSVDQFIAGSPENATNGGKAEQQARVGYVGRVNYNRSDKYLFQANFRYDGSHRFSKDDRFGFFPAMSAAWRLSEEDFFPNDGALSNLKFRASWGKFGNDRVNAFQYLSLFSIRSSVSAIGGTTRTGIRESVLPNPNITWEKATGTNIGFELGLVDNKIELEFDYFTKKTTDILVPAAGNFPDTFGANLPDENIGETENRGIEALVRYSNDFGEVHINTSANLTYATSKVVEMAEAENVNDYYRLTGQPIGVERGYIALGLFQSQQELDSWPRQDQDETNPNSSLSPGDIKYKDINGDNVIDGDDRTIIGKSELPEFIFGWNIATRYKGFSVTANLQGASGFTRYAQYIPFSIESNSRALLEDSWRPGNEGARFPRITVGTTSNNDKHSTFWLEEITYIRLRNVEFSYTLPTNLLENVGIESVRVYLAGNNLFTWSNVADIDPEGPSSFRPYYPQMKSMIMGLNITF